MNSVLPNLSTAQKIKLLHFATVYTLSEMIEHKENQQKLMNVAEDVVDLILTEDEKLEDFITLYVVTAAENLKNKELLDTIVDMDYYT
ncbi:DhNV_047 [Dikerogammarus haemobaphes nudivirus]|nr:DhNV_047 [Dikerogammarus haemobaphes nudivirus]